MKRKGRIVVRVEISTLFDAAGKLNIQRMDRLAMVISNMHNSGQELLVVTSGAIALGTDKLGISINSADYSMLMVAAAVGQAELIKQYQNCFDQYNQMVAQVLLTSDIMDDNKRMLNTQNTFDTLLHMNIIPIINENDVVSTSDIELDDNYPLALNVAKVCKADVILIKSDVNNNYIVQPRNNFKATVATNEKELFCMLDKALLDLSLEKEEVYSFPASIGDIVIENVSAQ
jgi:glutamate 5-kinase